MTENGIVDQLESAEYDNLAYALVVKSTNALNQITLYTVDYGTGKTLTMTDPNGSEHRFTYDTLGRVTGVFGPRDTANAKVKFNYANALTGKPSTQIIQMDNQINAGSTAYLWVKQYIDGFGRAWKEERQAAEGKTVVLQRKYEWNGLLSKEWLPKFSTDTASISPRTLVYDSQKRILSTTEPNTTKTTFSYCGLKSTITDARNNVRHEYRDCYNRLVKTE